jgi:hypothetical protein
MINEYNLLIKYRKYQIIIDDTFPKDLLIDIMKPYLELFLSSQYSLVYSDRINAKKMLKNKLYNFNKYNPLFSRKIYKKRLISNMHNIIERTQSIEYNKNHISFYESENIKDRNEFMTSHTDKFIEDSDYDEDEDEDIVSDEDNNGDDNTDDVVEDNITD